MADREKVIKGLRQHCEGSMFDRCGECPYYEVDHEPFICRDMLLNDLNELLKEQESWINEIAEYKQSVSGSGMHELDDYEKGKLDGLQIAWNIISEGR